MKTFKTQIDLDYLHSILADCERRIRQAEENPPVKEDKEAAYEYQNRIKERERWKETNRHFLSLIKYQIKAMGGSDAYH